MNSFTCVVAVREGVGGDGVCAWLGGGCSRIEIGVLCICMLVPFHFDLESSNGRKILRAS